MSELNSKLSEMRHGINNNLAIFMAGLEMLRYKPEAAQKMMGAVYEQPSKISESLTKFSREFEKVFGITRP